jgi:hypothetical protein
MKPICVLDKYQLDFRLGGGHGEVWQGERTPSRLPIDHN